MLKEKERMRERERVRGAAAAVAQLGEWSLPTQEDRSSNPVFGKFLHRTFVYCHL